MIISKVWSLMNIKDSVTNGWQFHFLHLEEEKEIYCKDELPMLLTKVDGLYQLVLK
jgi:hypothetical protein